MTTLTKLKLQNEKKVCLRNITKRTKKEREKKAATKICQEIDKKGRQNRPVQGENTKISAIKALKIRK